VQSYGVQVKLKNKEDLQEEVDRLVDEAGMLYLHSFDDMRIIAGHGRYSILAILIEHQLLLNNFSLIIFCPR